MKMTKSFMVASDSAMQKSRIGFPFSSIRPMMIPMKMEKTTRPRTFVLPV